MRACVRARGCVCVCVGGGVCVCVCVWGGGVCVCVCVGGGGVAVLLSLWYVCCLSYEPAHDKTSAQSDQSSLIACAFYSLRSMQRGINKNLAILGGCTG